MKPKVGNLSQIHSSPSRRASCGLTLRWFVAGGALAVWSMATAQAQRPDPEVQKALEDAMRTYPPGDYRSVIPKQESMMPSVSLQLKQAEANPLQRKLKRIIFPKVEMKDATVLSVLQWLSAESVQLDPEREGVAFALDVRLLSEPADRRTLDLPLLTLSLKNASLELALKFVSGITKLRCDVQGDTVVVRPEK